MSDAKKQTLRSFAQLAESPAANRLHVLAVDLLHGAKFNLDRAGPRLMARLRAEPALTLALVEANDELAHQAALYLTHTAQDMRGAAAGSSGSSTPSPDGAVGGGHHVTKNHAKHSAAGHLPRTAGLSGANKALRSLFDSVTVRGVAIGDLTFNQARSFAHLGRREAAILDHLIDKIGVPADANAPLRRLVKLSELKAALEKADNT